MAVALVLASCGTPSLRQGEENPGAKNAALYGGKRITAPFRHVVFCNQHPRDCSVIGNATVVQLTPEKSDELQAVNREVNASIQPQTDSPDILAGDSWTLSPATGDCDDYAVTKRHELLNLGWPSGALRLAEGLTQEGEGHLVLIASTDQGELVLDNETSRLRSPANAGLQWRSIQSASNPHVWLSFDGTDRTADNNT